MASGDIPFISAPLRNWKSFVPAWVVLPIVPSLLLKGANEDHLPGDPRGVRVDSYLRIPQAGAVPGSGRPWERRET